MLEWNQDFSVGILEMDEQHISLFHSFNDFCAAFEDGKSREETEPLLKALLKKAREHFSSEEAILNSNGFPGASDHTDHHKDLKTLMAEYVARFNRGELGSESNLLGFLRQWLTHHIEHEDKAYGQWLNEHGIH